MYDRVAIRAYIHDTFDGGTIDRANQFGLLFLQIYLNRLGAGSWRIDLLIWNIVARLNWQGNIRALELRGFRTEMLEIGAQDCI